MALIKLNELEQEIGSFLPFIGAVIDFKRSQQVSQAVSDLYNQTDALAVLVVQDIAAFLWWAYHIASATDDALGYSAQIQAAARAEGDYNAQAWTEWLNAKYPTDLRKLYAVLHAELDAVKGSIPKRQRINLRPLERAIADLDKWRKVTVTPDLRQWNLFYGNWKRNYMPPLLTLRRWLKTPSTFAAWGTLPILSHAQSTLRDKANQGLATAIETALIQTWVNDPQPVYNAVLQWLVTG